MRKPVIAGNWKMYKLLDEAVQTALSLKPLVANSNHCDIVIAPVFTALKTVADRLEALDAPERRHRQRGDHHEQRKRVAPACEDHQRRYAQSQPQQQGRVEQVVGRAGPNVDRAGQRAEE